MVWYPMFHHTTNPHFPFPISQTSHMQLTLSCFVFFPNLEIIIIIILIKITTQT